MSEPDGNKADPPEEPPEGKVPAQPEPGPTKQEWTPDPTAEALDDSHLTADLPPAEVHEEPLPDDPDTEISRVRRKPSPEFLAAAAPLDQRVGKRRWWEPPPGMPFSPEPSGHLTRNFAYEVAVALVSFLAAVITWFIVMGGEMQDVYVFYHRHAPASEQVSLVTIGEEALYLWNPDDPEPDVTPRPLIAELVRFLDAAGARVIVLDILLEEPAPGDEHLVAAAKAHGAVIGAEHWRLTDPSTGRHFVPGIISAYDGAIHPAFANMEEQPASLFAAELLVRRTGLLHRVSRVRVDGVWPNNVVGSYDNNSALMPGLGLAAAWLHQERGANPDATLRDLDKLLREHCTGVPLQCSITPAELGFPALPVAVHEPMDINFRGPEGADDIRTVRASQILRAMGQTELMATMMGAPVDPIVPEHLESALDDRVVVIGRVTGVGRPDADRFATPYSFPMYLDADMSGVRLHANVIDTLLSGSHVRQVSWWIEFTFGVGLAVLCWFSRRRLRDAIHAIFWLLAAAGLIYGGVLVFRWTDGLVFDTSLPVGLILATSFVLHLRGWAIEDSLDATVFDEESA